MKPARLTGRGGRKRRVERQRTGNGAYFRVEFIWQNVEGGQEYKPQRDHLSTKRNETEWNDHSLQ